MEIFQCNDLYAFPIFSLIYLVSLEALGPPPEFRIKFCGFELGLPPVKLHLGAAPCQGAALVWTTSTSDTKVTFMLYQLSICMFWFTIGKSCTWYLIWYQLGRGSKWAESTLKGDVKTLQTADWSEGIVTRIVRHTIVRHPAQTCNFFIDSTQILKSALKYLL